MIALGDLHTHRIPNRLVFPAVAIEFLLLVAVCTASARWTPLGRSALAGALLVLFYGLFALTAAMGAGDVKFAALDGVVLGWIGWSALLLGVLAGLLLAFLTSVAMIAARRGGRRTEVAFAPAMYLGAAVVICCTVR